MKEIQFTLLKNDYIVPRIIPRDDILYGIAGTAQTSTDLELDHVSIYSVTSISLSTFSPDISGKFPIFTNIWEYFRMFTNIPSYPLTRFIVRTGLLNVFHCTIRCTTNR